jgi:serine/threonine-protein kinase
LAERTQYGKYTIVAKIGQGAMGEVYKAHDSVLDRHVAVKTISASLESSPDARLRFHREAQSIARLNHPNIVTVFDFGEEGGVVYMAMELLEGSDLRNLIAAKHPMGLDERLALMEQVCDGVGYAHSMSVIHRDLKPANIHVTSSRHVKVMDFGLARIGAASGMTATGAVLGTPHYVSPEQVKGHKADPRSDVFALGAILYELLTGRQPFEAESVHAVLFRILETEPESVRRWIPDIAEPVVALAAKALTKDPARRFATGAEMATAVVAVLAELSGSGSREATLATLLAGEAQQGETHLIPPTSQGNLALEALVDSGAERAPGATPLGQPTLSGKAPTRPGSGQRARTAAAGGGLRWMLVGAAVVVIAAAGGLLSWGLLGRAAEPSPPPAAAASGPSALEQQLLAAERKLAQESLQDREYREAIDHAGRALAVSAADAESLRVREAARQALDSADAAANSARAALEQGDTTTAGRRLEELLEIQPGHLAVAELTGQLNDSFRPQAEQAKAAMRQAEAEARRLGATSGDAVEGAGRLSREGAGAFARREYAVAAEKFLGARDGFARAGRAAEARRAASRPTAPPPTPEARPAATAVAPPAPAPAREAARPANPGPTATPSTAAANTSPAPMESAPSPLTTTRPVPPPAAAPASAPPPAARPAPPPGPSDEELIRALVEDYGRAIETKDLGLFRRVKPNLSGDEEQRLRQAFEAGQHDVNIEILDVSVSGNTARVRLVRRDGMNGNALKPFQQVLSLRRGPSGWTVESIGR